MFGSGWFIVAVTCAFFVVLVGTVLIWRGGSSLEDVRRAELEERICRMLRTLTGVESAKVLLKGRNGHEPAGASVIVTMHRGTELTEDLAATMASLVESAVPGLKSSDVTVVDALRPNKPMSRRGDDIGGESAYLIKLRLDIERELAARLRAFFAAMQIECAVAVSVELDADRVREHALELDPQGRGELVLREERVEGTNTRKVEAAVSYITREIVRSPRGIAHIRASVVLFDRLVETPDGRLVYDRTVVPEKVKLGEYARLACRALGLDDPSAVEVQYLPSPRHEPPSIERPRGYAVAAVYVVLGAGAAGFLTLAWLLVKTRARGRPSEAVRPAEAPAVPQPAPDIRSELRRLVAEDIDRAAGILSRWIAREGT